MLPARAESAEEAVSARVEAVAEPARGEVAEGLFAEVEELPDEVVTEETSAGEAEAEAAVTNGARYGRLAEGAELTEKAGELPFARVTRGGAALILERADGLVRVAFNTEFGVITGWCADGQIAEMDDLAVAAFLDDLATSGCAVLFEDNLDTPLDTLECEKIEYNGEAADAAEENTGDALLEAADGDDDLEDMYAAAGFALEHEKIVVSVGDSHVINVLDVNGRTIDNEKILFESSDNSVATVNDSGVVVACQPGNAAIVVSYNGRMLMSAVTVRDTNSGVVFEDRALNLGIAQRATLCAAVTDGDDDAELTYTVDAGSPDPACIALDSETGEVLAVSRGTAIVKATADNGAFGICQINVLSAPVAIRLSSETASIGVKENFDGLIAMLVPPEGEKLCAADVSWSTSSARTVSVNTETGVITGLKTGSAIITASTHNGLTASCKVTVKKAPSKLLLGTDSLVLSAGGMKAQLTPSTNKNTASGDIEYTSSDVNVVTVDENGVVTSVNPGKATITGATYNGKRDTCEVVVYPAPGKVTLDSVELAIGTGETVTLDAVAAARDGSETVTNLTFFVDSNSPDPDCVSVDPESGEITGIRKGKAFVNAMTHNGVTAWFPCTVYVRSAPAAISLPKTLELGAGEQHEALVAELTPPAGEITCAAELFWSSSNGKVLSVDAETGAIKALKKGSATITARTAGGLKATCQVTVLKAPSKVVLSPDSLKLSAGGMQFKLNAAVNKGSKSSVTFTSSNTKVATVSADGTITTVEKGTATITATTYNGKKDTCELTVTAKPVKASFDTTRLVMTANETAKAEVKVLASDGSEALADLNFTILSGADYIDLDPETGEITALKNGVSMVTVETHNGVRASNVCVVTVVPAATGVELTESSISLGEGETYALGVAIQGEYGCDTQVSWKSSNEKVAKVDERGNVTAVDTGSATISVTTSNNLTATCKVTVKKAPESVSISPASGSLYVGATGQYKVSFSSGAAGHCTFVSSNKAVATVDEDGVVTAISVGSVTITATTYNGLTATATLSVKEAGAPEVPESLEKLGIASYQSVYNANMSDAQKIEYVIYNAQNQLGMPYIYGGGYSTANPSGFDCSGLVYWCYRKIGIKLGDSAYKQGYDNNYTKIVNIEDLKRGDVVCFNTSDDSDLSDHTGIYLGNGYFIHASSGKSKMKVVVQRMYSDSISNDYYQRNFSWGRRIL